MSRMPKLPDADIPEEADLAAAQPLRAQAEIFLLKT